jgi:hypothetical protein
MTGLRGKSIEMSGGEARSFLAEGFKLSPEGV